MFWRARSCGQRRAVQYLIALYLCSTPANINFSLYKQYKLQLVQVVAACVIMGALGLICSGCCFNGYTDFLFLITDYICFWA